MVECVLQLCLLGVLAALLEQVITVLGEELGALGGRVGRLGDGVVVDELAAGLVEGRDESAVVVEGREHERVVLLVDLEDRGHVQFGVLRIKNIRFRVQMGSREASLSIRWNSV